jgi:hypothetical protein
MFTGQSSHVAGVGHPFATYSFDFQEGGASKDSRGAPDADNFSAGG